MYYNIHIIDMNGKDKYEWQITHMKDEYKSEQIIEWGHADNIDEAISDATFYYRKYQHFDKGRYPMLAYGYCEDCNEYLLNQRPRTIYTDSTDNNICEEKFYVCPKCGATFVHKEVKRLKTDECYITWERKFWG